MWKTVHPSARVQACECHPGNAYRGLELDDLQQRIEQLEERIGYMRRGNAGSAKRIAQLEKQLVNNGDGSDLFQRAMAEVLQEATDEELNIAAGSGRTGTLQLMRNDRMHELFEAGQKKGKQIQRRKGEKIMNNNEEEKVQAAYKESVVDSTQEAPLTEEEAYVKDKILEHYDGEEEGTLVFTQAMAEAAADAILKAESYLYNTGIEKHEKAVNVLGEQAKQLAKNSEKKRCNHKP